HRDLLWANSVIYYFARPVVVETGVIVARSSPGAILSQTPFVATTIGPPGQRSVTVRLAAGREAYQRISADRALVAFSSQAPSIGTCSRHGVGHSREARRRSDLAGAPSPCRRRSFRRRFPSSPSTPPSPAAPR